MSQTEQFIASLVHSLAWPAAVFGAAALFRKQLGALLSGSVRRLKAGPVELEFDRVISSVEASLDKEPLPGDRPPDLLSPLVEDLLPVAKQSPAAAVLEAHARLEHALWELTKDLEEPGRPVAAVGLARLARAHGLITPETETAILGVTTLRNLTAHGRQIEVSVERAMDYLTLIDAVLFAIRPSGSAD